MELMFGMAAMLGLAVFGVVWFQRGLTKPSPNADSEGVWLDGDGEFDQEIVGEAFYQDVLAALCGPKTEAGANLEMDAQLVLDDLNPHDNQAVAVLLGGQRVGHLSREDARDFRDEMEDLGLSGRRLFCRAKVTGGWRRTRGGRADEGHYGVRLDLA